MLLAAAQSRRQKNLLCYVNDGLKNCLKIVVSRQTVLNLIYKLLDHATTGFMGCHKLAKHIETKTQAIANTCVGV